MDSLTSYTFVTQKPAVALEMAQICIASTMFHAIHVHADTWYRFVLCGPSAVSTNINLTLPPTSFMNRTPSSVGGGTPRPEPVHIPHASGHPGFLRAMYTELRELLSAERGGPLVQMLCRAG